MAAADGTHPNEQSTPAIPAKRYARHPPTPLLKPHAPISLTPETLDPAYVDYVADTCPSHRGHHYDENAKMSAFLRNAVRITSNSCPLCFGVRNRTSPPLPRSVLELRRDLSLQLIAQLVKASDFHPSSLANPLSLHNPGYGEDVRRF